MKTTIAIIITLALLSTAQAVILSIDVPAADVPRVQEAFGSILGLGRPANLVEVQGATKQWLIGSTQDFERRKNMATYTPPPMEMQPSPTPAPTAGGLKAAPTPKKK